MTSKSDEDMRPRVSWMVPVDPEILRFYTGHEIQGFAAPPMVVYLNTGLSAAHTQRRITALTEAGLLERVENTKGYYRITERGRRYLRGDVEKDEMEALTPAARDADEEDVWESLGERRRALLMALSDVDQATVDTTELRERTDVPDGSIIYHLEQLVEQGLVDEVEECEEQRSSTARIWRLTEEGISVIEDENDDTEQREE